LQIRHAAVTVGSRRQSWSFSVRPLHAPVWLTSVRVPRPITFAYLWCGSTLARGLLITVLPLTAHEVFGDAQTVSEFYFAVSILSLASGLAMPWLVARLRRRWVFTLGCLGMAASCVLVPLGTGPAFAVGMLLQMVGVIAVELPLNLYILDHVPRRDLIRFEPIRLFFAAGPWTVGPWLGVALQENVSVWAPFALSGAAALALLAYFWVLRIGEHPALARPRTAPVNPIRFVPRYVRQPRLRLAWVMAFGRAGWWYMFFIYTPIYCVTSGLGPEVSGALISLGSGGILAAPLWGRVARRVGLRRHMTWAYGATGLITACVALVAPWPWVGAGVILLATIAMSAIDGSGNTHFLRAVRPLERAEMTAVFGLYRDSAQLIVPGFFALLLLVLPLPSVFVASGLMTGAIGLLAFYLPRRM
jgi:MFS family permease